jgi:GT2 family glycosyltransferase
MVAESDPLIVIVAYHNTPDLAAVLESIGPGQAVLVVDNGVDDDVRQLVDSYGGLYLTPGSNVGFAAAVNLALSRRDGRDVLLVNPDARLTPDLPNALRAVMERDARIAAVAPRLRDRDGVRQQVEWPIPSPREEWVKALKLQWLSPPKHVFLIGAVLLLRSDAVDDVGLFDERFFLYAEECDWQLRAVKRGWRLQLASDCTAEHSGGGSSEANSAREAHFYRSATLFAVKWYGRRGLASMRLAALLGNVLRLGVNVFRPEQRAHYARLLRPSAMGRNGDA